MIRIQNLKLPVTHTSKAFYDKIITTLKIRPDDLISWEIRKRSIDARKLPNIYYIYQIDATIRKEEGFLKRNRNKDVQKVNPVIWQMPVSGTTPLKTRPVVIGSGPAGLFCALILARAGYKPLVLERGQDAATRKAQVDGFWQGGPLNPDSNVQFGEGGAGTFSDGKLNTQVKDTTGRMRKTLEIFTEHGAAEEILYDQKPHLGTDQLIDLVTSIRKEIESLGGTVRFGAKVTGFQVSGGVLTGLTVNETEQIPVEAVVLAIGHSARDTFFALDQAGVPMEAKPFAVGVRMEHPQSQINLQQYGTEEHPTLGAAPYKLTAQCDNGRGVYSFCMCPGGYVVNASTEEERLCVNGMSYSDRGGSNANSAIIVTVKPEDFGAYHVEGTNPELDGIAFQRNLEHAAYQAGEGRIPVQLFGDFAEKKLTKSLGAVKPQNKGDWQFGDVAGIFPDEIHASLVEGIRIMGRKIPEFDRPDAVLSGVEARTSSPVRITRNDNLEAEAVTGLYPCGEGAGYAGGITSAAMDGIRVAEKIIEKYQLL